MRSLTHTSAQGPAWGSARFVPWGFPQGGCSGVTPSLGLPSVLGPDAPTPTHPHRWDLLIKTSLKRLVTVAWLGAELGGDGVTQCRWMNVDTSRNTHRARTGGGWGSRGSGLRSPHAASRGVQGVLCECPQLWALLFPATSALTVGSYVHNHSITP